MPPEIRITRKDMTAAALALIEEGERLTARNVAKRLGISTQPIYREYGDMKGLTEAVTEQGFDLFAETIDGDALDQATGYVMFALEHGNLFNFLFRAQKLKYEGLDALSHGLIPSTDIIARLCRTTGLNKDRVYRLHLYTWMALHGLASLAADNEIVFSVGDVEEMTKDMTSALAYYWRGGI